ncbi:DUF3499 domain-containing protein [Propioniciclava flava]|uniref:DUF3499 domain-containing protein n=1 Tax=Propioniciclava flava TaxID=2072026 RepID=A0A4V1Q797_9ACTN|nr:DUF3499 domain-containing protein [Propioniciclava flava]RXW31828.1 DUF3499 domain-containing protein [Propioniciclava flava]
MKPRLCTKSGCQQAAIATLTYAYADRAAVVGPLALRHEPGSYDLCGEHCAGLSTPRGWELIRLPLDTAEPAPSHDDLLALADAVREVGLTWDDPGATEPGPQPRVSRRRGHLGVVADLDAAADTLEP